MRAHDDNAAGLAALDAHLATRATVSGYALDANDATVYITVVAALKASTEALTHVRVLVRHALEKSASHRIAVLACIDTQ